MPKARYWKHDAMTSKSTMRYFRTYPIDCTCLDIWSTWVKKEKNAPPGKWLPRKSPPEISSSWQLSQTIKKRKTEEDFCHDQIYCMSPRPPFPPSPKAIPRSILAQEESWWLEMILDGGLGHGSLSFIISIWAVPNPQKAGIIPFPMATIPMPSFPFPMSSFPSGTTTWGFLCLKKVVQYEQMDKIFTRWKIKITYILCVIHARIRTITANFVIFAYCESNKQPNIRTSKMRFSHC